MKNSLIIAVSVSVFSILIAYPVAYTLSRLKFKGRRIFSKSVLFMYLLPTTVLYIPLYMLVSKMHLTNTIWGLIVIYPTFTLPYVAWILIPHIAAVPKELEEAAMSDRLPAESLFMLKASRYPRRFADYLAGQRRS